MSVMLLTKVDVDLWIDKEQRTPVGHGGGYRRQETEYRSQESGRHRSPMCCGHFTEARKSEIVMRQTGWGRSCAKTILFVTAVNPCRSQAETVSGQMIVKQALRGMQD